MPSPKHVVVLVTAPDRKVARALARVALEARLCACANLVPGIESHYWWQGAVETSREVLLILKTTRRRLAALEKRVLQSHPYEVPEIVVLPLSQGTRAYLDWLEASTASPAQIL
mgnify:CR=1 FL=1